MDSILTHPPPELELTGSSLADPATIGAIYTHYFARISTYVRYRVADAAVADDLTAHIFERMVQRIATYNPQRGPFVVWLWAIARNSVNDHLRAGRRQRWLSLDAFREWLSPLPQPEDTVVAAERRDDLLRAVARLGERERDLIALKFVGHLPNRRIAELTGLSQSNVAVIVHRTLKRLRADLEAEDSDE